MLSALTAVVRFYPTRAGDFFLLAGLGTSAREVRTGSSGFSVTASENGTAALLGAGYDLRVGRNLSLTPFANLIGVDFDGEGTGSSQIGLSLTAH